MKKRIMVFAIAAMVILLAVSAQHSWVQEATSEPEMVMKRFLRAFVSYDYETCRSLLVPEATITITRRYQGGTYQSQHQSAYAWLDQVGETGVKEIEDFSVDLHESAGFKHAHGATVVLRFTSTGMTGQGLFVNTGFDTGNLIETPDGWRIIHYSSFEDFRWGETN